MNVFKDIHYIYENLSKKLRSFELTGVEAKDILDAIDGHIGQGYGQSTQKEIGMVVSGVAIIIPDSKFHGANMGPIWGRQDPGGLHVGPMNFAIWDTHMLLQW